MKTILQRGITEVVKLMQAFLLSILFFYLTTPGCKVYLTIVLILWGTFLQSYGSAKNKEVLFHMLSFTIGNLAAYLLMKGINGASLKGMDLAEWVLLILCMAELLIVVFLITKEMKANRNKQEMKIFSSRRYDLERICDFIFRVDILGINSEWGNGKSFVVECLSREPKIQEKFELIRIDLLTCNLDEIVVILMNELEKVLNKHRILSRSSRQIRKMLGKNQFLEHIQEVLANDNTTISSAFSEFKQDVEKLRKNILIIYEDIDRITEVSVIKKIFAISEKLSCDKISILYQYDQENMEQAGLNRDFVEKYIPFVVNLTNITFEDIVEELWDEIWNETDMTETGIDKKEVLYNIYINQKIDEFEKVTNIESTISLLKMTAPIRKVRIFMEEIKSALKQNHTFCLKENRNIIIQFYFVKNFYYSSYEKLKIGVNIEEALQFRYKGNQYTMDQLLQNYTEAKDGFSNEDILQILSEDKNKENYFVLALFQCYFNIGKTNFKRDSYAIEEKWILKKKEKAEKTNRIIWNLLGNGRSEFTNMETALQKFIIDVLESKDRNKNEVWNRYCDDLNHGRLWKDNSTIFLMGLDLYLPIFRGFQIFNESSEHWIQLLQFYDDMNTEKKITVELIENLNYCDLSKKAVFLLAMKLFCEYDIIGNMNKEKGYAAFFIKYFEAVYYFGYSRSYHFNGIENYYNDQQNSDIKYVTELLNRMEDQMHDEKNELVISDAKEECDLIIKFIRKNRSLIGEQSIVPPRKTIHTEFHSERRNNKQYSRLLEYLKKDKDSKAFMSEVEKSYREEKITPSELRELMENKINFEQKDTEKEI